MEVLSLESKSRPTLVYPLPTITPCTLSVFPNKWPSHTLLSAKALTSSGTETLTLRTLVLQSSALNEPVPIAEGG